jgi:hypothetical protein
MTRMRVLAHGARVRRQRAQEQAHRLVCCRQTKGDLIGRPSGRINSSLSRETFPFSAERDMRGFFCGVRGADVIVRKQRNVTTFVPTFRRLRPRLLLWAAHRNVVHVLPSGPATPARVWTGDAALHTYGRPEFTESREPNAAPFFGCPRRRVFAFPDKCRPTRLAIVQSESGNARRIDRRTAGLLSVQALGQLCLCTGRARWRMV